MKASVVWIVPILTVLICAGMVAPTGLLYWGLAPVALGVGWIWFARYLKTSLDQPRCGAGQCNNCGYDLRRTHWSKPCPECGMLMTVEQQYDSYDRQCTEFRDHFRRTDDAAVKSRGRVETQSTFPFA
jgi:hypothetical protein